MLGYTRNGRCSAYKPVSRTSPAPPATQAFRKFISGACSEDITPEIPLRTDKQTERVMMTTLNSELCRSILESLPAAVYVVDRERRILLWNAQAETLSGFPRHEVIGRQCRDDILLHCNEHGTILCGSACPLLETMHDGRPRSVELYMRHKMGHRLPVRVQSVVVRDEGGAVIGAVELFEEVPVKHGRVLDRASMQTLLHAQFVDYEERRIPFGVLLIEIQGLPDMDRMYGRPAEHEITSELAA